MLQGATESMPNQFSYVTCCSDVALWCIMSVDQVNTKVCRGQTVRYLQRYLKAWESHPQLRSNILLFSYA